MTKTAIFAAKLSSMSFSPENIVVDLYRQWSGHSPGRIVPLPPSGSSRQYFRLYAQNQTYIAAFNPDKRENQAFLEMTRLFTEKGLPVPKLLAEEPGKHAYLLSDLGDTTLFSMLPHNRANEPFAPELIALYKRAIEWLVVFQKEGAKKLDTSICYPRKAFDRHSMMWDLNYFKYYFLKTSGIPFDEQKLEESFESFIQHLLKAPGHFFMYRDFQSRNIMILNDDPYFIDYQGGRLGALQYDIASLLFDAKANIPFKQRGELLNHYIATAADHGLTQADQFIALYYDFVLIRVMQALATYGFRGGVEKKPLFLQSMPYAINNLKWLASESLLPKNIPYLHQLIEGIATQMEAEFPVEHPGKLTIALRSFSYRHGIPADHTGHGGGFVFDCRILPNPGRLDAFKKLTGKDNEVIRYLQQEDVVEKFLESATMLVDAGIAAYLQRGHRHLMISFGCTGGQHRSVYCAEQLSKYLQKTHARIHIDLQHREEKNWPRK